MTSEVNLFEVRNSVGGAHKPTLSEVARFKDEGGSASSKVIADSQRFVVYSLKNPAQLRVLVKSEYPTVQVAFKSHTAPVRSAKFVSDLSNICATSSDRELLVWYIDSEGAPSAADGKKTYQIHTYFSAPITTVSLSWVPIRDRPPNVLILYRQLPEDTTPCTAAILKSSDLIVQSSPTDPLSKIAKQPDGTLTAKPDDFDLLAKNLP